MLAPPVASLPQAKRVRSHASLITAIVYLRFSSTSALYLSGCHLAPGGANTIYLFRQHIISFWRSQFTQVTAILGAARSKARARHLEIMRVTPSRSEGSGSPDAQILRYAKA